METKKRRAVAAELRVKDVVESEDESESASALIICPLLSIVDDQIKEAKDLGITACRLKDFLEEETSTLRPKQLMFASAEDVLSPVL